jgi:hypothetical protein
MGIIDALRILEAATIECKTRDVGTPEVREALDVLAPYCRPEWRVTGFRGHLKAAEEFGAGGEGQQQNLRVCFAGIHANVRKLLTSQIGKPNYRYKKSNDAILKAELDRLTAELERLPERWKFVARREES